MHPWRVEKGHVARIGPPAVCLSRNVEWIAFSKRRARQVQYAATTARQGSINCRASVRGAKCRETVSTFCAELSIPRRVQMNFNLVR